MDIALSQELQDFIEEQLKTGEFSSVSDVVREALNLLKEQREHNPLDDMTEEELAELRRELQVAIDELDRDEGKPWDVEEIKAEGRRLLAEERRTQAK